MRLLRKLVILAVLVVGGYTIGAIVGTLIDMFLYPDSMPSHYYGLVELIGMVAVIWKFWPFDRKPALTSATVNAAPASAATSFCAQCGQVLNVDDKYCGHCGANRPAPAIKH